MSDLPTDAELQLIEASFANLDFGDVEIVDKLRDVRLEAETKNERHFVGTCFGQSTEDDSSFLVSFHCILEKDGKAQALVSSAYAYDTRSGNEIAAA